MAARKKTTTTQSATVTKKASKKPATRKKMTEVKESSVETTQSSTSSDSRLSMGTSPKKYLPKLSRKNLYVIAVVAGIIILGYLASKYLVVAWVDRKPITRIELYRMLEKRHGKEIQEELIVEKLLMSEAQKRGVSVAQNEVDDEIKKLEEQVGGADKLDQFIQANNLTKEDFLRVTKIRLLIQKVFGKDTNVSDEELNKYIDENKESLLPPPQEGSPAGEIDDKTRQSVRDSLKQQKVNEAFNTWLQEAQNSPRVIKQ